MTQPEISPNKFCVYKTYRLLHQAIFIALTFFTFLQSSAYAQDNAGDPVTSVEVTVNSPTRSSLDGPWRDSVDTASITVYCSDKAGKAVQNATVTLSAAGPGTVTTQASPATTDANGDVQATVTSTDVNTSDGVVTITATSGSGSGSGTVTFKGVQLVSLSAVSGASQTGCLQGYPNPGGQNWAALKASNQFAVFKLTTQPDIAPVWNAIKWGGGQAVPGQSSNENEYSLSASADVPVSPTITGTGLKNATNLWIVWASVKVLMTTGQSEPPGAADLSGADWGLNTLGSVYNPTKTAGAGAYVVEGVLSPSGVNKVVSGGWKLKRNRWGHAYVNGNPYPSFYDSSWTDDSSTAHQVDTPDSNDLIYDSDAPAVNGAASVSHIEFYVNFEEWVEWNQSYASDSAPASTTFCYKGKWSATQSPQVYVNTITPGALNPLP